jgi:hypothetical protein
MHIIISLHSKSKTEEQMDVYGINTRYEKSTTSYHFQLFAKGTVAQAGM